MNIQPLVFYAFAGVLVAAALLVVFSRNPVHCALWLVLSFFSAAGVWLLLEAEFLAIALVLVYVGAVTVLFLFVVMMLDIDFEQMRGGFQRYAPVGAAVGIVLLVELGIVLGGWKFAPDAMTLRFAPTVATVPNTEQLGRLLYTDYVLLFQAAGLILLVAMIGAIVLTLRDRTTSRHQDIGRQLARHSADTMVFVEVRVGAGAKETGILRPPEPEPEPVAPADVLHGGH